MTGTLDQKRAFAALTQARLELGQRGRAMTTRDTQSFALDHAQARAAVQSAMDVVALSRALADEGLDTQALVSEAASRDTYIRRPDLGRQLPDGARQTLEQVAGDYDVAIVVADGLSATAVTLNGAAMVRALTRAMHNADLSVAPVILAEQARVALGDSIALALGAKTVVVLIGERPGLSASDSLGAYITHRPEPGLPDSRRNFISNIRDAGLSVDEASRQVMRLIGDMRRTGLSGVGLASALNALDGLDNGTQA